MGRAPQISRSKTANGHGLVMALWPRMLTFGSFPQAAADKKPSRQVLEVDDFPGKISRPGKLRLGEQLVGRGFEHRPRP